MTYEYLSGGFGSGEKKAKNVNKEIKLEQFNLIRVEDLDVVLAS